jgi:hypothetical protein
VQGDGPDALPYIDSLILTELNPNHAHYANGSPELTIGASHAVTPKPPRKGPGQGVPQHPQDRRHVV